MFKRILVPLDGSRLSTKALPYAIEVAKKFGAEAILLRVVQPTIHLTVAGPATMAGVTFEKATQEAKLQDKKDEVNAGRYLRQQLRMLAGKGVKGSYNVIKGTPGESIIKFCRKNHIELVVMTTHGRSGLRRTVLGSVADQVLREPGVHVLAIRPKK